MTTATHIDTNQTLQTISENQVALAYRYYPTYYGRRSTACSYRCVDVWDAEDAAQYMATHPSAYIVAGPGAQYYRKQG